MTGRRPADDASQALGLALALVALITFVRVCVLILSPLNLYPDEAQYWWWAQSPAFGYFSKPPVIAWIIWLSTALFGQAEWAVRIASPILHGASAMMIYAIARRAYAPRPALLCALAYLTSPGVSYSSGLISTDVPLLLFWSIALYAFLRACDDASWRWPVLCGLALGLGIETKYAMLFFLAGALLAALLIREARQMVLGPRGIAIVAIAAVLVLPNLVWNAQNGFPTIAHTQSNAAWDRAHFSAVHALGFVAGQFGVFGPLLMAGYVGAIWRLCRAKEGNRDEYVLALFSLPPLTAIIVQAFIAAANANWAVTAFIAATPLAVAELERWWRRRILWLSFAVNGLAMIALWVILLRPTVADTVGLGNAFKREEGWRELGRIVVRAADAAPYRAIVTDNRSLMAELLYYAQPRSLPLRMWDRDDRIRDHFQMTMRLQPGPERVLVVAEPTDAPHILATFDSAKVVELVDISLAVRRVRQIALCDAQGYRGPQIRHAGAQLSPVSDL
ncbi:MAG TPA: glycosyltransferase family 39 protein [Rhizomicrobium sp.]|jgi:hypothetical protein